MGSFFAFDEVCKASSSNLGTGTVSRHSQATEPCGVAAPVGFDYQPVEWLVSAGV
jgi:hypothetical protein